MTAARRILAGLLLLLSFVPVITSAQSATSPICLISHSTYALGTRGAEVSVIQGFLVDGGFLNSEPTGYFGRLTEAAVAQFQLSSGITTSLRDGGVFGRRTWAYVVQHSCVQSQPAPRTDITICPGPPPRPMTVSCDSSWQRIMTDQGCHVGWSCVTYVTTSTTTTNVVKRNYAPVIYAIQGPLSVTLGNSATWVMRAADQENDKLSYSMIWGDEGANLSQLLDLSGQGTNYSTSNSFAHKYSSPGVYTMIGYVKDEPGNTNKATVTVTVANSPPVTPVSTSTTPPPPPPGPGSCTFNGVTYASSTTIRNPICENIELTCSSSRYLKCSNRNWVPTNDPGSSTGDSCVMNGHGYSVGQVYGGDATIYGDPNSANGGCRAAGDTQDRCAPAGSIVCGSSGWQGSKAPGNFRTGCMSSNNVFDASGVRVYGPCLTEAVNECVPGNNHVKTAYFMCRADGWWSIDSSGNLLHAITTLPNADSTF